MNAGKVAWVVIACLEDGPVFEGTRLVELWIRGIADFVDVNGLATVYSAYAFENGDKFFVRSDLVAASFASLHPRTRIRV